MAAPIDVGLGFSESDAFSVPQSTFAGTVFNFGSAGDIGDDFSGYTQSATATATAAASGKGDALLDANPNARTNWSGFLPGVDNSTIMVIGAIVAIAAIGAYVYYNNQG